jgi:hypothetical protein
VIGSDRRAVTSPDRALEVVIQRRFGVLSEKTAEALEGDCRSMRRGVKRLEGEALAKLRIILGRELWNWEGATPARRTGGEGLPACYYLNRNPPQWLPAHFLETGSSAGWN